MNADRRRQLLVLGTFVFAIGLNAAANIVPLNGQTTGEISDRFRVFVVPAGYVFSIWGLIYLGQLAFVLYTLWPRNLEHPLLRRIGLLPAVVATLNGLWILLWHYEVFPATVAVMVALLVSLIVLYRRAGFEHTARPGPGGLRGAERWFVQVPFSLYLGWITVATIANIASVGNWAGVTTLGVQPELVAAIVLAVGLAIAVTVLVRTADVAYGAVIIWAYVGIVVKEMNTDWVPLVAGASVVVVALLVVAALGGRLPLHRRRAPAV
jgi:translocator protein